MKRAASTGLLLLLSLCLAAGPALAGAPVQLRAALVDTDGWITLGDLFDGAGRAANVRLAAGPSAGGTSMLDARWVQGMARSAGLDWSNPEDYQRLVVSGAASGAAGGANPGPAGAAASVEVLTYTRNLAAGEIVRAEDVVWSSVQAHLAAQDGPSDLDRVIGMAVRRPVRLGAVVSQRELLPPRVIHRDDLIQIAYVDGGVNLVLQGKALSDASVGESFPVLNTQSKKTIEAVAAAPGRALVGPEADRFNAASAQSLR